ncbi:unnamed protein product [Prunus armeniaca]|uniref:NFD4 C-terminal domain-containing protein n=1 Tax=Prunus armeniaca TaxID=36596 RepID=A0A6J5XH86_PRUAR|nr:unnamed protein product [Prunus armeniaca]
MLALLPAINTLYLMWFVRIHKKNEGNEKKHRNHVWSLMPTITSEIFGLLHMGTIFNAITIAAPVGSYIFSVRVIGYIYDKEASTAWNTCTGTHCFRLSFLIMACATFLGSLTE